MHILRNVHVYGTSTDTMTLLTDTMTLLTPINKVIMLNPYEQLFIHTFHHNSDLIIEQSTGPEDSRRLRLPDIKTIGT